MRANRQRGRRTDPAKARLVLLEKYNDPSPSHFAEVIDNKLSSPSRASIMAFCQGAKTDEKTWRPLCLELGVDFSLLEKGSRPSDSISVLGSHEFKRHWTFSHPASFAGQVWVRVVTKPINRGQPHRYFIRWGPWGYTNTLNLEGREAVTLLHMKGDDGDSIPLFFDVSPPCCVSFGRGDPPVGPSIEINFGWSRVEGP
jgi:hypothetical protein